MAFEDSHTLFIVKWLRLLSLENELQKWYDYQDKLVKEKKRYRRKKVYSRLYEFFSELVEEYPERNDEMMEAYDYVLQDIDVEEKLELDIGI
jgi:hypothetical protein